MDKMNLQFNYTISIDEIKQKINQDLENIFNKNYISKANITITFDENVGLIVGINSDTSATKTRKSKKTISKETEPEEMKKETLTDKTTLVENPDFNINTDTNNPLEIIEEIMNKDSPKQEEKEEVKVKKIKLFDDEPSNLNSLEPAIKTNNPVLSDTVSSIKNLNTETYKQLFEKAKTSQLTPAEQLSMLKFEQDPSAVYNAVYKDNPVKGTINDEAKSVEDPTNKEENEYLNYWTVLHQLNNPNTVITTPAIGNFYYQNKKVHNSRIRNVYNTLTKQKTTYFKDNNATVMSILPKN